MTIMLTQWLCKPRHAAFAMPWDDADITAEQIVAEGRAGAEKLGLDVDQCTLCGGRLTPEHSTTRFTSMEEAIPALARQAAEIQMGAHLLRSLGMTVDSPRE